MGLKRDIGEDERLANGHANGLPTTVPNGDTEDNGSVEKPLDMVVVGAGFAGVWLIQKLRERGFKAKIVDVSVLLRCLLYWQC